MSVNAHVAVIENTSGGDSADVLALKVGSTTPTGSNNFITFFGGNAPVGRIEGNGAGGMSFLSGGADFAECLPRLDQEEQIEEGDIVGVFAGKISKQTEGAQHVAVISGRPIVVGNLPPAGNEQWVNKVAIVGQVRVKVRGPVQAGDFIVPSGEADGVGSAIPPDQLTTGIHTAIVGRAWESSDSAGVRTVNIAVGFAGGAAEAALVSLLRDQQSDLATLRREVERLAATKAV